MLFNQTDNLYDQCLSQSEKGLIVAPSPQMADIIRRKLKSGALLEVITISKFLKDELTTLVGDDISENYRGKSELLLLLSSLWKKLDVPGGSYELFQRCFRLLTDLRSFSMNDDVLETALEYYDQNIAYGVMRMHQILNQLDIYDEHRSYFQLSERLRSGDLPITYATERNLFFMGFDFLSGSQVDLLKAYAIRDNVALPVYQKVYESLAGSDWLSWLDGEEIQKTTIDPERPVKEVGLRFFPKNYLSKALKSELLNSKNDFCQIILGERRASIETIQQVNLRSSQYKTPAGTLEDKVEWLIEQIASEDSLPVETLLASLGGLFDKAVANQDFRALKAIQLLRSIVEEWRELSEDNEIVSAFDAKILKEALLLDSPRVFQTALGQSSSRVEIKSLKEIDDIQRQAFKILCITSEFTSPKSSLVQYTEGLEKYLSSIGPLRRAELEFVALKEKLLDILDDKSTALVEEGVLTRNLSWKSLFDSLRTKSAALDLKFEKKALYHEAVNCEEAVPPCAISATRLQTFIDCPRKYLFKYVFKWSPSYVFQDQLDSLELGRLQHKTIEEYVGRFNHYSQEDHEALVKALLDAACANKNLDR
ncbi:MAG: PD-(D/E)XK nuclease family protein, partial [Bacteriovoracaceae bacterium]